MGKWKEDNSILKGSMLQALAMMQNIEEVESWFSLPLDLKKCGRSLPLVLLFSWDNAPFQGLGVKTQSVEAEEGGPVLCCCFICMCKGGSWKSPGQWCVW